MSSRPRLVPVLMLTLSLGSAASVYLSAQTAPARASESSVHTARVRRVPLEGALNFRDLGGYRTQDGRHVRWGLVYRSNHLANLTTADYRQLNDLGIRLICDLRTTGERQRSPTVWQGGVAPEIVTASILKETDVVLSPDRLKELTTASRAGNALSDTYSRMVTESPEQYGLVLRRLARGPLPAVTHCTAGKDRTGVFAALLLTILGVPRDVVVQDYMLTGEYMLTEPAMRQASVDWQKLTGSTEPVSKDMLRSLYTMHEDALTGTFATIDRTFGSFDVFVRDGLKLTPTEVAMLRLRLLE